MTAEAIFQATFAAGDKIDNLWSMYIGVHLGIFWLILLVARPLLWIERSIAFIAYTVFISVNGNALRATYIMLDNLRLDLISRHNEFKAAAPRIYAQFQNVDFTERVDLILLTHSAAWVIVCLLLLFRNSMIRSFQKRYPDYAAQQKNIEIM